VAISISIELSCSRGDMVHLLLFEHGGCQNDTLAARLDAGAQKERAQVLLHGSRADCEFGGNLLIAAALDKKVKHLLVPVRDFDLVEVEHDFLSG
jgi:hypothetical protein